jgi:6-phospho-3-hexuloisomerase
MIKTNVNLVVSEIKQVLSDISQKEVNELVKAIIEADKIVVCGAGRVGMAARSFGMRLAHLGLRAFSLGDSNLVKVGEGDLLIACSGSGETITIADVVSIAKSNGVKIVLITGNPDSSMGKLSDIILQLKAPSKVKPIEGLKSIQPMTTLNEQSLMILLDLVVLELMESLGEDHDTMWARHSILE